jgi:hypothetical protein
MAEFGLTKTYFSENIQKIKFFNLFRKKVITKKNELCSYSVPIFILKMQKIIFLKKSIFDCFNIKSLFFG